MINVEKIKARKGFTYEFKAVPKVDSEFVKALRKKLNMSQSLFALAMNVEKKTVEKWEQGKNPISNGNAYLMILYDKKPELVNEFIVVQSPVKPIIECELSFETDEKKCSKQKNTFTYRQEQKRIEPSIWRLQPVGNN